jgi:Tol biopolymer transport system component
MREDFDAAVADRFKMLNRVIVPDNWSRVQFKALDEMSTEVTAQDMPPFDVEMTSRSDGAEPGPNRLVMVGLLAAVAVLVVVAAVAFGRDPGEGIVVTNTPSSVPVTSTTIANGWVTFAAGQDADRRSGDTDIYLVRDGSPASRVAGSDDDAIDQVCPAFSPDGKRLAYGEAAGTGELGYQAAGLVIVDLATDGRPSATTTITLDDMSRPPCAIWSADGRWLAFGAGSFNSISQAVSEIWVVDTDTDDLRRLTGLSATDIDWSPDANELYLASEGRLSLYSVATDRTRPLAWPPTTETSIDDTWGVQYLDVSPDGRRIVVQGERAYKSIGGGEPNTTSDLRLLHLDDTGEGMRLVDGGVISPDFDQMHGIGPVWSPDGQQIAYQRVCRSRPESRLSCREQHEVVVVTLNDNDDPTDPARNSADDLTEKVISPPETTSTDGTKLYWYPFNVSWSPDSTTLLYAAWAETQPEPISLLAVRVDGESPPVMIYDDLDISVYDGYPRVSFQSWSRQPT